MNNLLVINLEEDLLTKEYEKKYDLKGKKDYYIFEIQSTKYEDYNKIIKDYNLIRKYLNESYIECDYDPENLKDYKLLLSKFVNKDDNFYQNFINNIEYVKIIGDFETVKTYLEKNPILKTKKIILSDAFDLEYDTKYITKLFANFNNIYVEIMGNDLPITLEELNKTQTIIKNIAEYIKKYNFSPIEQLMYLYDKVRERMYVRENKEESYTESRDLTKVLTGNKIVCAGYANIIDAIVKMLNFSSFKNYIIHKNKDVGHVLNAIYVKDDKYNINGIFYFDATWDSKRDNTNDYLYSYKYFAKNKSTIEGYQKHLFTNVDLNGYSDKMVDNFIEKVNSKGIREVDKNIINTINTLSKLVYGETLIKALMCMPENLVPDFLKCEFNKEDIIEKVKYLDSLLNQEIDCDTMLKILYNVRKVEYYNEPNKFAFDINLIFNVIYNSNWLYSDATIKLFASIFGKDSALENIKKYTFKQYYKTDTGLNMERIRLTKTLRNVYESKKHN